MSVLRRAFALARRLRAELVVAGGGCFALAVAGGVLARSLDSAIRGGSCAEDSICGLATLLQLVPYMRDALFAAPIIAGALIAASLVAREFEQGTIAFAWTTCPDRRRWLIDTCKVGLMAVTVFGLAPCFASAAITEVLGPQQDAGLSLRPLDGSPAALLASSWVAFVVTAALSLLARRAIPALLYGVIASVLAVGLIEAGFLMWAQANAVPIDPTAGGSYYLRTAYESSDGRLMSPPEAADVAASSGHLPAEVFNEISLGLPSSTRLSMVAGMTGSELALAGLTTLVAISYVGRQQLD